MFEVEAPTGSLEQGDVCLDVPLPTLDVGSKIIRDSSAAEGISEATLMARQRPKGFLVVPYFGPVLVLSQSCDLATAEEDGSRLLLAPILDEEASRLFTALKEPLAQPPSLEELAPLASNPNQLPPALTKAAKAASKQREAALRKLWLGELIGLMPIGMVGEFDRPQLKRSVCSFEHATSVPAIEWSAVLRRKRIARMKPHWRSILQEKLVEWLGRFAYPGTEEQRVAVARLNEDTRGEPEKGKAATPAPPPFATDKPQGA